MRLSVAIKAHPDREVLVEELLDRLDGPAEVIWDRGFGNWDTSERAWAAHDPVADWHLVLEDDAIVCRDLLAGTARMLADLPAHTVASMYLGDHSQIRIYQEAEQVATETGASWIRGPQLVWGVAIAAPTGSITEMLAACAGRGEPYDTRLALYYDQAGYGAYFTWPSLVEHADVPSLLGHNPHRRARRFIGADASALDIDPRRPIVATRNASRSRRNLTVGIEHRDLMVARRSAALRLDDRRMVVRQGITTAERGARIVAEHPDLWEPLRVDHPAETKPARMGESVEQATAAPGEKRDVTPKLGEEPKSKRGRKPKASETAES